VAAPDEFMRSELDAMRKRGITAADPFFFRFSFAEVERLIRYVDRLKTDNQQTDDSERA
jgi:hypothetical protein